MTTKEAAIMLGRSVRTIRYYIANGILPATKDAGDRDYRIKQEDVEALKENLTYAQRKEKMTW